MKTSEVKLNMVVGRLTVKEFSTIIKNDNSKTNKIRRCAAVICECFCGNIKQIMTQSLNNPITNCGCLALQKVSALKITDNRQVAANNMRSHLACRTECSLTSNEIKNLIFLPCFYCGKSPEEVGSEKLTISSSVFVKNTERKKTKIDKNIGLDRVDTDYGYHINNVVPCCFNCNLIKTGSSINFIVDNYLTISKNAKKITDGLTPVFQEYNANKLIINHCQQNCKCTELIKNGRNCKRKRGEKRHIELPELAVYKVRHQADNVCKIDLTDQEISNIIFSENCFYCERNVFVCGNFHKRDKRVNSPCSIRYLGIDRIDRNSGYINNNVINCCGTCNYIKNKFSVKQLSDTAFNIHAKISALASGAITI